MDYKLKNISKIERDILQIIVRLKEKGKQFSFKKLLKICNLKLNYSEREIFTVLNDFYKKSILVEGKQLVRSEILANPNRELLYQFINENPGVHLRGIIKTTNLPLQTCCWHLAVLEQFQFIKSIKVKNQLCFGVDDLPNVEIRAHHLLRNKLNKKIITTVDEHQQLSIEELSNKLGVNPSTLRYHIKDLKKVGLLLSVQENNQQVLKIRS